MERLGRPVLHLAVALVVLAALPASAAVRSDSALLDEAPGAVDLRLTKSRTDGTGELAVGAVGVFRLTVRNAGPDGATGLVVTDTLPDGLAYVGGSSECAAAGQVVTCAGGSLAAFDQLFFDLRVRAEPAAAERTLTNRAVATADQPDVAPDDNGASLDVSIGPYSALGATKTASAAAVSAGSSVAFTATVRNDGPSAASDVRLIDLLPAGLSLRSATPSQGACAALVCDLGGLPADETARVEIVADVDVSAAGRRVNAVEVTASSPSAPARAEAPFEIVPRAAPAPSGPRPADLAVPVRPPARATEGAPGDWRLEVVNAGPGAASGVSLGAAARPGADLVGAREAQAGCTTRLPVSCELGSLAAGERRTVRLRLRPRAPGLLTLTGTVGAAQAEAAPADNVGSASVRVAQGRARVALRLTPRPAAVPPGGLVTFAIAVRNPGRIAARGLRVCGRLPGALTLSVAPGARLASGDPCWSLPLLRPGAARTYRMAARAPAGATRAPVTAATVRGTNVETTTARVRVRLLQGAAAPGVTG
jgi:uncharacterized repeat protein (TIGR01451 family)